MILNGLFREHRTATKQFSDSTGLEITTVKGMKYHLHRVKDSKIIVEAGCKQLTLHGCKNLTIVAERLPIMGVDIIRTDNTSMTIDPTEPVGGGFINLDHSVIGTLEINQDCRVEILECKGIILNGENISDKYRDSTWTLP